MPISGVLLADKPAGLSSTQVLGRAKRLLGEKKAGHTGTLDPFATGLLPLCFGEATKFSRFALDATKGYRATLRFGITTSTGDPEGEVLERRPVDLSRVAVVETLARFLGDGVQIPPMYSALKHAGRPLYELARQGIEVERAPRPVTIHALDLVSFEGDTMTIDVTCSKGTYIRTLAMEIGRALGCGAHLTALCRTRVGRFRLDEALTLETLEALPEGPRASRLLPPEALLAHLPHVLLDRQQAADFRQGRRVQVPGAGTGECAVFGTDRLLLGVGHWIDGALHARRSVQQLPDQI
jgi:tRNA pseudouridine55 synthase